MSLEEVGVRPAELHQSGFGGGKGPLAGGWKASADSLLLAVSSLRVPLGCSCAESCSLLPVAFLGHLPPVPSGDKEYEGSPDTRTPHP